MMRNWLLASILIAAFPVLTWQLLLRGYADVLAGLLAVLMATSGIWLSAKGMTQLKQHETEPISDRALETAYRYRNAGLAFGLTGSGPLVLSWETFLGRFIRA
ncbi:MAG: hypothetical protein F4X64_05465 [Chloroflexi bacterium]|nr:hypothetical protein [Chloroflexota bacterium]